MKIAHVQVKPILSGAQQISYDILSSLKDEGHQLYIICSEFDENSDDFIKKFGAINVEIITIPSLKRELGVHDFKVVFDLYDIFDFSLCNSLILLCNSLCQPPAGSGIGASVHYHVSAAKFGQQAANLVVLLLVVQGIAEFVH